MIISLLFVMIPSILVGITSILGYHIFRDWGPFYTLCLLLTGFINSIIYVTLHMELRQAAIQVIRRKNNTVGPGIVVSATSQIVQEPNRKQNS
uniref:Uncharacterized protein n=1 Tax=Acrobeloides nanus TaxID=290746 RepID=A0A914ELM0_9BILA